MRGRRQSTTEFRDPRKFGGVVPNVPDWSSPICAFRMSMDLACCSKRRANPRIYVVIVTGYMRRASPIMHPPMERAIERIERRVEALSRRADSEMTANRRPAPQYSEESPQKLG